MNRLEKGIIGENNHLFFNNGRLFINSELGCLSRCEYCYLNEIGLTTGKITSSIDANTIIDTINLNPLNLWSPENNIVAFGCYSDPWGIPSKGKTIAIMQYLDALGYKVTISTKQFIRQSDLDCLGDIDRRRFVFLISLPLPDSIALFEKGTSSLRQRIKSIEALLNNNFRVAVYIKPFIEGHTIRGFEALSNIFKTYKIPAILGRVFTDNDQKNGQKAVVSNSVHLYEEDSEEYLRMKNALQEITTVYENSYSVFGN